jgi:hypothetical protein
VTGVKGFGAALCKSNVGRIKKYSTTTSDEVNVPRM